MRRHRYHRSVVTPQRRLGGDGSCCRRAVIDQFMQQGTWPPCCFKFPRTAADTSAAPPELWLAIQHRSIQHKSESRDGRMTFLTGFFELVKFAKAWARHLWKLCSACHCCIVCDDGPGDQFSRRIFSFFVVDHGDEFCCRRPERFGEHSIHSIHNARGHSKETECTQVFVGAILRITYAYLGPPSDFGLGIVVLIAMSCF